MQRAGFMGRRRDARDDVDAAAAWLEWNAHVTRVNFKWHNFYMYYTHICTFYARRPRNISHSSHAGHLASVAVNALSGVRISANKLYCTMAVFAIDHSGGSA